MPCGWASAFPFHVFHEAAHLVVDCHQPGQLQRLVAMLELKGQELRVQDAWWALMDVQLLCGRGHVLENASWAAGLFPALFPGEHGMVVLVMTG